MGKTPLLKIGSKKPKKGGAMAAAARAALLER